MIALAALAALVGRKEVDVIFVSGPGIRVARDATPAVPFVFFPAAATRSRTAWSPVSRIREATSLASAFSTANWTPSGSSCCLNWFPGSSCSPCSLATPAIRIPTNVIHDLQEARGAFEWSGNLFSLKASTASEIDAAFASLIQLKAGALVVASDPFFTAQRDQLLALAAYAMRFRQFMNGAKQPRPAAY